MSRRTLPELNRPPVCVNGQPCPLPPPVRESTPQTAGCEGCQRTFLLVTYFSRGQGAQAFWCDERVHEQHVRDWYGDYQLERAGCDLPAGTREAR